MYLVMEEEEEEEEEEMVKEDVGWQGSEFMWFLLPNGTLGAGPSTT